MASEAQWLGHYPCDPVTQHLCAFVSLQKMRLDWYCVPSWLRKLHIANVKYFFNACRALSTVPSTQQLLNKY